MRVPEDVRQTVNAYLAFRAVILAGDFHFLPFFLSFCQLLFYLDVCFMHCIND